MKPQQLKQIIREEIKNITKSLTEGKYDADLDKIEAAVKNASSFMNVGAELKKAGIKYDFSTSMIPMYTVKVSGNTIAIVNKKYAAGAEREVNNIAIGLLEGKIKESVNETKFYAFWGNKKHEIEANDLWDAKQKAITMLKVPKSKVGLLAVVNAKAHDGGSFMYELDGGKIKESTENFIGAALVKKSGMVKDLDSLEKEPIYVRDVLPIYRKEGSSYVVKSLMTGNALKVPAANLIVKMKDQFEPDKWAKFMAKMTRY